MTRLTFALISISIATSGCVARAGYGFGAGTTMSSSLPPPPPPPPESAPEAVPAPAEGTPIGVAPTGGAYAPGEDAHWFTANDYLISSKPYENKKLGVRVAKMTAAATG